MDSEASPGGEDFGLGVPDGGGLQHGGRKAVESEGEKSSGVAAESAGDVPERRAQKDAKGEERKAREPAPIRFRGEQASRPGEQRRGSHQGNEWGVLGVEASVIAGDFHGKCAGGSGKGAPATSPP